MGLVPEYKELEPESESEFEPQSESPFELPINQPPYSDTAPEQFIEASEEEMSPAAIAGIVIACLLGAVLLAVIIYVVVKGEKK